MVCGLDVGVLTVLFKIGVVLLARVSHVRDYIAEAPVELCLHPFKERYQRRCIRWIGE